MNTIICKAAVPPPAARPPSTAVRVPSLVFLPGVIAFDEGDRAHALEDRIRVLKSLNLEPGSWAVEVCPC